MRILFYALVWLNGAGIGAAATAVFLWYQLATGKRSVRPIKGSGSKFWNDPNL